MRGDLTYDCGCFFTLDLAPWSNTPDGGFRACHAHRRPASVAGQSARRPLSLTYHAVPRSRHREHGEVRSRAEKLVRARLGT